MDYTKIKGGKATIGGTEIHFRSSWEITVAYYLEFCRLKGEILKWEYEPDTFWFLKILRGVRSYKPDFKITKNDGSIYYEEVKGYMDSKSKTKLNRMRIYHPNIEVRVLDKDRYKSIERHLKSYINYINSNYAV
jgi:hypothetical protein